MGGSNAACYRLLLGLLLTFELAEVAGQLLSTGDPHIYVSTTRRVVTLTLRPSRQRCRFRFQVHCQIIRLRF
jgi:hypothetical protein